MPCGTGKSLTAYWIAQSLDARRIVVAVPSLALIRQTLGVWLRESVASGREFEWLCVCSDETAGIVRGDDHAIETKDIGVPCYTNVDLIRNWLQRRAQSTRVVIFTTYQSGRVLAKAVADCKFDLGIYDEAHKTTGPKNKLFAHLLFDENIKIKSRLLMTATERRYLGSSDQIVSMEDQDIYGSTPYHMNFKEAMDCDPRILSDYKVLIISVTKSEVKELVSSNAYIRPKDVDWDEDTEARVLASAIAVRKAISDHSVNHVLSFHRSVKQAKAFSTLIGSLNTLLETDNNLGTHHVNGAMNAGKRDSILREFASGAPSLISNARCLTEGVDLPQIDAVVFADPKRSAIDIVQATGRALRIHEGKKFGYVILPILFDEDEAKYLEDEALGTGYESVLSVLRSLASNDERLIDWFRTKSHGRSTYTDIVVFDSTEKMSRAIDLSSFASSIELKCWQGIARLSWRPFSEARCFVRSLSLNNYREWLLYCKVELPGQAEKPEDIPVNPDTYYKGEWKNWGDWLGK